MANSRYRSRYVSHVDHLMLERFPWLFPRLACHLYKAYSAGARGCALSLAVVFSANRSSYVNVFMGNVIVRRLIRLWYKSRNTNRSWAKVRLLTNKDQWNTCVLSYSRYLLNLMWLWAWFISAHTRKVSPDPGRLAGGLLKPLQITLVAHFGREPKWLSYIDVGVRFGREPNCVRGKRTSVRARTELCARKTVIPWTII